ncbi:MAG TPA: glycosyl hydrolase family 28-related protein [Polyangiaceae bacterium]|nr:glycosyl hydrolase family 28-related protein [Polyangiaceae bacterium]
MRVLSYVVLALASAALGPFACSSETSPNPTSSTTMGPTTTTGEGGSADSGRGGVTTGGGARPDSGGAGSGNGGSGGAGASTGRDASAGAAGSVGGAADSSAGGSSGGTTPIDGGRADAGGSDGGIRPDASSSDTGNRADAGDSDGGGSGPAIPPANRGATPTYWEYQAEDGDTNGTRIGPSRVPGDPASEASQRRAVRLDATGQYVRITSKSVANSIVVRYSIPDRGEGPDSWSTLSVYVNGALRTKLQVTSRWSWTYGDYPNPSPNDPAQGKPHHFYDEARALIGDVPVGGIVSVQKDASDSAVYYVVDLIDLEQVAAPQPLPANFISITDCGATPDDDTDDQAAIQACVDMARNQGRGVYIPRGTFRSIARPISVDSITMRGAGMWYSTLSGFNAKLDCYGNACKYYDFAVLGDTVVRDDASPESAFSGVTGNATLLENIWAEHSKTGYWVGPNANNLVIRRCRFRNLHADGVNLWRGTSNSIIEQTHLRNTGDDSLASWSPSGGTPSTNNVWRFNTVQLPWMANCFGLYGGNDNRIEDNICEDVVQYSGILVSRQFGSLPFGGTTQILRNNLVRAGGFAYNLEQGAIKFYASEAAMTGFLVQDLFVQDSTFFGIQIQGANRIDNLRFQNVLISAPSTSGIRLNFDANGTATANGLVVTSGGMDDQSRGAFTWTRETGNSGW